MRRAASKTETVGEDIKLLDQTEDDELSISEGSQPGHRLPYQPDALSLLEWDEARKEIEAIYRTELADDDPLRMFFDVTRIAWMRTNKAAAGFVKATLAEALTEFNQSLDQAMKARRQEAQSDVLRMLVVAQERFKATREASVNEIQSATRDLQAATDELRQTNRSIRWFDWFVGAVFMAVLLLVGIGAGFLYSRA